MSTVTAVPLQPVKKSALTTLWVGIIALAVLALAYGWWTTRIPAIEFTVVKEGTGPSPTDTDIALIKYKGALADGTVFDQQEQAPMPVGSVVPGFSQALKRMKKGGSYKIVIPPELGYGKEAKHDQSGKEVIPANSDLHFDVDLLDFRSQAEVEAMQQMMQQQMMQQMQQQGGQGGGAPKGQ